MYFNRARTYAAISLCALLLCSCAHNAVEDRTLVVSTPLSADSETVVTRRTEAPDTARLTQLLLLRIARDCLSDGYLTFAFTSVSEPKPHLPDKPPDAPAEFASTRVFDPPTSRVPAIEPGTVVSVKFYKEGDPRAGDSIYAQLIVANLGPALQQ